MYNILICDDEQDIVNALKIYLSGGDYCLFEASNGREALEVVEKNDIHLILMDIMMPQLDGIAATAKLREKSNVPIILLTAKSESSDKVLGLNIGADDYITDVYKRQVYARYKMGEGDRFSVTFIHSVNKYPLTDTYEIENKTIYVEETTYCSFGAGVQTELNPGETLDKVYVDRPDYKGWAMVIRNIHQDRTNVGYIVGTVSDHVLNVNGEDVSLRDLCGKNAPVRFNYEFWLV